MRAHFPAPFQPFSGLIPHPPFPARPFPLAPTLRPMLASARLLNSFLTPGDLPAAEIERALTFAGFPIENTEPLTGELAGDTRLDVELTSNRGDCFSHLGLARELAAVTGRTFTAPAPRLPEAAGPGIHASITLDSADTAACPLFTLALITGVKVGPSPDWLRHALEACGHRSINNIVDVSNYVLLEMGIPNHAFDLAKLAKVGASTSVIVRSAKAGEKLTLLDGKTVDLKPTDMVIADAHVPKSLAGIMGGAESGVSAATTDVLLEVATWDPVRVRTTARRLNLRTDASYRYERTVPPETLAAARDRLIELVIKVAGGTLREGVLSAGRPAAKARQITLRIPRLQQVLGVDTADFNAAHAAKALARQGFDVAFGSPGELSVTVPHARPDVKLEIDLIEEVARTVGYDKIPVLTRLGVAAQPLQGREAATAELCRILSSCGMFEAVSFSFTGAKKAKAFLPAGLATAAVSEERRAADNILRPSPISGLLDVRRVNQDGKVRQPGGVRLFELASAFSQDAKPDATTGLPISREAPRLCLTIDLPEKSPAGNTGALDRRQAGVSLLRGILEQAVAATLGPAATLKLVPEHAPPIAALDPSACARVLINGAPVGHLGIITADVQRLFELEQPVVVAEIDVLALVSSWPPKATARELPTFPATDRDVSVIVSETVLWDDIAGAITAAAPAKLESLRFVTTYRGKPLEAGKKSVTFRMTFRDPAATLTDDAVNPQVDKLISHLGSAVGAVVRTV